MRHSGSADLVLMGGGIPSWLFDRMVNLSRPIVEAILLDYGHKEFLRRLSDPFWFQSFGSVIGMDWNSSGVTTAVMGALKKSLNPYSKELGLYVCGGKGKDSLKTPNELIDVAEKTGLDGAYLARSSKLSAKVDNAAVQDGFQLYLHNFVVSAAGDWTVVQQGMNPNNSAARRYHWHSETITSFVEEPHAAICGEPQGEILNLVDKNALPAQRAIMTLASDSVDKTIAEMKRLVMPTHNNIRASDVDLKKLGTILHLAQEAAVGGFEELLLLRGVGPRTLQSLALTSEIIHGAPARFKDPARFSFALGGKGRRRPFPVPTKVYDETISILKSSIEKAKLGEAEKHDAIKKLTRIAQTMEKDFTPNDYFDELVKKENEESWKYGGRTIEGFAQPPIPKQLSLFESDALLTKESFRKKWD